MNRKILAVALMALMTTSSFAVIIVSENVEASGPFTSGYYEYTLIDDGTAVEITWYDGPDGYVDIPSTIDGKPVTRIGNNAFFGANLTGVSIPNSVTSIGDGAFEYQLYLRSVTIPDSVTSIGKEAFRESSSLTYLKIGNGVTQIGDYAFWRCPSMTSLAIPDSVVSIGKGAFMYWTSMTYATIGDGVTILPEYIFYMCTALESIHIGQNVTHIGHDSFYYCTALKTVKIPDSVRTIGEGAFVFCESLTNVVIGKGVTMIGDSAFEGCIALPSIILPSGLICIDDDAFMNCESLTSIVIPENVRFIGNATFLDCISLTNITFRGNAPSIGASWLYRCPYSLTLYYYLGASGFSTPSWNGRPCYPLTIYPTAPLDLQTSSSVDSIALSWSPPESSGASAIIGYKVYRATSTDGIYDQIATVLRTSFTDSSVELGQTYWYRVRAYNSNGDGFLGDVASAKVGPYSIALTTQYQGYFLSGREIDNTFSLTELSSDPNLQSVTGTINGASYSFSRSSDDPLLWTYTMNMGNLPPGNHVLKVAATFNDGYTATVSRTVQIVDTPSWLDGLLGQGESSLTSSGTTWKITVDIPPKNGMEILRATGMADYEFIGGNYGFANAFKMKLTIDGANNVDFSFKLQAPTLYLGVCQLSIFGGMEVIGNDMDVDPIFCRITWTSMQVQLEFGANAKAIVPLLGFETDVFGHRITVGLVARFEVKPSFGIVMELEPSDDPARQLVQGIGMAIKGFYGQAKVPFTIAVDCGIGVASVSGGGTLTLTAGLDSSPDHIKDFKITGRLFFEVTALTLTATLFEATGTLYQWPDNTLTANDQALTDSFVGLLSEALSEASNQSSVWHVSTRYYVGPGYDVINWSSASGQVVERVYPSTDVALVMGDDGSAYIFYTTDDASRPALTGLNIHNLVYDSQSNAWTEFSFPSDDCMHFAPQAVVMDDGRIRVTWNSVPYEVMENLSSPLALTSTELMTGIYDPGDGSWSDIVALSASGIINGYAVSSKDGRDHMVAVKSGLFFGYDTSLVLFDLTDGSSSLIFDAQNISRVDSFDAVNGLVQVTMMDGSRELVMFGESSATMHNIPIWNDGNPVNAGITSSGQLFVVYSSSDEQGSSVSIYNPVSMSLLYNITGLPAGLDEVKFFDHDGVTMLVCSSAEGITVFSYGTSLVEIKNWAVANCTQFDVAISGDVIGVCALGRLSSPDEQPELRMYYFNATLFPGAPTNVTVTPGNAKVTLTWQTPSEGGKATEYDVYQDGSMVGTFNFTSVVITGLANGQTYTFSVVARNMFGYGPNSAAVTAVPFNPLNVTITSPVDGSYLGNGNVTISWTVNSSASVINTTELSLDGTNWIDVAGYSSTIMVLNDGSYTVFIRATDSEGNINETSVSFIVDTIAPTLEISAPLDGSYLNSPSVMISWAANDNGSGLSCFLVRVDNGDWTRVDAANGSAPLDGLSDGTHTIELQAADRAGNAFTRFIDITVDTIAPSVEVTSPSNGANIGSSSVTAQWTANDTGSEVATIQVQLDGGTWTDVAVDVRSHTFDGLNDGAHVVAVRVVDTAGNIGIGSANFIVTTGPSVSIISPSDGSFVRWNLLTVRWIASDTGSGIAYFQVKMDDGAWRYVPAECSSTIMVCSGEGYHAVTVRAVNNAGVVSETSASFIVDTTAPSLRITSPTLGAVLRSRSVDVQWTASDLSSGIAYYRVTLDLGTWTTVPADSTSYTFTNVPRGIHLITVEAVDHAGNINIAATLFLAWP